MTTTVDRVVPAPEPGSSSHRRGPVERLTSTDHKNIGVLYCVTAFIFFLVGGALAGVIRLELAEPGRQIVANETYNGLFTIHGTVMIFLFVAPFGAGLANYLIPLQIGAPDMAFPRLNLMSFWFFVGGGLLILLSGFAAAGGGAAMGWTAYPPLSGLAHSPGVGPDLWILGLALVAISSVMTAVNILTTVFLMRAPGMTMWRLPIFTWNMIVVAILGLVAFPPAVAGLSLLLVDRRLGGHVYDPLGGGDPTIYQHLFWFLGHPEVYILILPFFGVITGDHPRVLAQASLRLHGFRPGHRGDRGALGGRVGAPHVRDRGRRQPVLRRDDAADRRADGGEVLQLVGFDVGRPVVVRHADAVLGRVLAQLPDRWRHGCAAGRTGPRLPIERLLLRGGALPLHDGRWLGLRDLRRDLLLVPEDDGRDAPRERSARSSSCCSSWAST